jgi:hypothetical protein
VPGNCQVEFVRSELNTVNPDAVLAKLFHLAGIDGYAHVSETRFSVELLLAGVPMEDVSILLEHGSVKMQLRERVCIALKQVK